jgi:hypothetical protein
MGLSSGGALPGGRRGDAEGRRLRVLEHLGHGVGPLEFGQQTARHQRVRRRRQLRRVALAHVRHAHDGDSHARLLLQGAGTAGADRL